MPFRICIERRDLRNGISVLRSCAQQRYLVILSRRLSIAFCIMVCVRKNCASFMETQRAHRVLRHTRRAASVCYSVFIRSTWDKKETHGFISTRSLGIK